MLNIRNVRDVTIDFSSSIFRASEKAERTISAAAGQSRWILSEDSDQAGEDEIGIC